MSILHIDLGRSFRGGQRQALLLHRGLLERGQDSHFIANSEGALLRKLEEGKDPGVHGVLAPKVGPPMVRRLRAFSSVKHIVDRIQPSIIHFHEPESLIYARLLRGYLSIETRRVSMPVKSLSAWVKYRNVDAHVGVCEYIANHLKSRGLGNVSTIHSAVDLDRFTSVTPQPLTKPRAYNFLYVGAISQMKGVDVLLRAFAEIKKKRADIALHIVGDGRGLGEINGLAQALGIEADLRFYGHVSNPESYYVGADAVVVPSRRGEGSNGIIKEALAAGKTLIASDFAPNRELVEHRHNGLLFENENVGSLIEMMNAVVENKHPLDSRVIRASVTKFGVAHMVGAYCELYHAMLAAANKPGLIEDVDVEFAGGVDISGMQKV